MCRDERILDPKPVQDGFGKPIVNADEGLLEQSLVACCPHFRESGHNGLWIPEILVFREEKIGGGPFGYGQHRVGEPRDFGYGGRKGDRLLAKTRAPPEHEARPTQAILDAIREITGKPKHAQYPYPGRPI
jgi:hypothetical protein